MNSLSNLSIINSDFSSFQLPLSLLKTAQSHPMVRTNVNHHICIRFTIYVFIDFSWLNWRTAKHTMDIWSVAIHGWISICAKSSAHQRFVRFISVSKLFTLHFFIGRTVTNFGVCLNATFAAVPSNTCVSQTKWSTWSKRMPKSSRAIVKRWKEVAIKWTSDNKVDHKAEIPAIGIHFSREDKAIVAAISIKIRITRSRNSKSIEDFEFEFLEYILLL